MEHERERERERERINVKEREREIRHVKEGENKRVWANFWVGRITL